MSLDLDEKGTPVVDRNACTGCGTCVTACPDGVFAIEDRKATVGRGDFLGCIACGHCIATCPSNCITVTGRGMMADDAFALPNTPGATPEQLETMLLARRSVRRFKDREIDRTTMDRILAMTATAPMGLPPSDVAVVVFHGRDRVQTFAKDACEAFRQGAWFFHPIVQTILRPLFGKEGSKVMRQFVGPLLKTLVEKRAEGEDWLAYNAAAVLLFHYGPMGGEADCHIAATYAMLAAESFGLGSCLLGTTAALNMAKPFRKKYGIPAKNKFGLALVLGYPDETFRRGVRRRLASVHFV